MAPKVFGAIREMAPKFSGPIEMAPKVFGATEMAPKFSWPIEMAPKLGSRVRALGH